MTTMQWIILGAISVGAVIYSFTHRWDKPEKEMTDKELKEQQDMFTKDWYDEEPR